jgi:hypothetical protein
MKTAEFIDNYCGELIVTYPDGRFLDANYGVFW